MKKYMGWLPALIVAVLFIGLLVFTWLNQRKLKAECLEHGGQVVEIENGGRWFTGWFCRELSW